MSEVLKVSEADVLITDELWTRAPQKTDYLQEKLALQDLAAKMVDQPQSVLPRFVELAMEITGGISAGLSLFEPEPSPGVFRWQHLCGILSPFEGATTPRDFSPCGVTLDQNGPVLCLHAERYYGWISDANIVVPEVLLVPLYLGSKEPLGTLWIVADKTGHFDSGHARVMTELAAFVGAALRMVRAEEQLRRSLEDKETLAREMNHRVKNLFALTDGMIRMSARSTASKEEMTEALSGRLHALARAHSLVGNNFADLADVSHGSDFAQLLHTIVEPHEAADDAEARFTIAGPSIHCGDAALNGISLVFHELATNAAKYGALVHHDGRVSVTWRTQDGHLIVDWNESGGPSVEGVPSTGGFGGKLVKSTITRQFGGSVDYDWRRIGLAVKVDLPLDRLTI